MNRGPERTYSSKATSSSWITFAEQPLRPMHRLRFFQGFAILLTLAFLSAGGSLLHGSISNPGMQPWELVAGALLCSLAFTVVYFLWKYAERQNPGPRCPKGTTS